MPVAYQASSLRLHGEPVAAIAMDYGGYAVTFRASRACSRCSRPQRTQRPRWRHCGLAAGGTCKRRELGPLRSMGRPRAQRSGAVGEPWPAMGARAPGAVAALSPARPVPARHAGAGLPARLVESANRAAARRHRVLRRHRDGSRVDPDPGTCSRWQAAAHHRPHPQRSLERRGRTPFLPGPPASRPRPSRLRSPLGKHHDPCLTTRDRTMTTQTTTPHSCEQIAAIALDYGGYAVTFQVPQLPLDRAATGGASRQGRNRTTL
jgi:hypothetical protein